MLAVFTSEQVARLIDLHVLRERIRQAHIDHALGRIGAPGRLDAGGVGREYHVKTGEASGVYAVKANSGFFENPPLMPAIQGMILVFDGANGSPTGLIHSGSLTALRTAAASCVAITALRPGATSVAVIGTGSQAASHMTSLRHAFPSAAIQQFSPPGRPAKDAADHVVPFTSIGLREFEVVVTCTSARTPFLDVDDVRGGALIVAVGADAPGKRELCPELIDASTIVADVVAQSHAVGEAQHVAESSRNHSSTLELGQILANRRSVPDAGQMTVYDSTGTGFQDAAAASAMLEFSDLLPPDMQLDW